MASERFWKRFERYALDYFITYFAIGLFTLASLISILSTKIRDMLPLTDQEIIMGLTAAIGILFISVIRKSKDSSTKIENMITNVLKLDNDVNGKLNPKIDEINIRIKQLLEESNHYLKIRYDKECSLAQVNIMLSEAQELLKKNLSVDIYEAHFEPNPPENNSIIENHKNLIANAAEKNLGLKWRIIVGNIDGAKDSWIKILRDTLGSYDGGSIYNVIELKNSRPSLNFICIPELRQTYMGLGNWLGGERTGGIWIKDRVISSAMKEVFSKLETIALAS